MLRRECAIWRSGPTESDYHAVVRERDELEFRLADEVGRSDKGWAYAGMMFWLFIVSVGGLVVELMSHL